VYVTIDAKELERTKKDMIERAIGDVGKADQKKDDVRVGDYDGDITIEDIDGLHIIVSLPFATFSFGIDSIDDMIAVVDAVNAKADVLWTALRGGKV
jgi:hypothetical protein